MKTAPLCAVLLIAACFLTSCDKDGQEPAPEVVLDAKTKALTSHVWRVAGHVSIEKVAGRPDTTDTYATYEAWAKDNTYRFKADNTFTVNEGSVKSPDVPQVVKGVWRFSNDQKTIVLGLRKYDPLGTFSSRPDSSIDFELIGVNDALFQFGLAAGVQYHIHTLKPI